MSQKPPNIAVVGSRSFDDYELLANKLRQCLPFVLVSGAASGADNLSEKFADEHNLRKIIFPAEWDKYGKRAGFIRNKMIVENADLVIAFWDGVSKGTKNTINLAKKNDVPVYVVEY